MGKLIILSSLYIYVLTATMSAYSEALVQAEGQLEKAFSSWGKASLQGDWKIIHVDGKNYIELAENFRAKEGPDVKIFLSPLESGEITGKNAAQNSAFIYQISDFEGADRIHIPDNIEIAQFKSLVFHCEEYSKLWGVSPL